MEERDEIASDQDALLGGREKRIRKLINAEITVGGCQKYPIIVKNISEFGFCGRGDMSVSPGDVISVSKAGFGQVKGEVRWVSGNLFGVRFFGPIDVDQFNFADNNKKGHFVEPVRDGYVWNGFDIKTETKRPGVTPLFSRR